MTAVTPTDRPKSVRNSCVIKVFGGVFMLSRCFLDCSVGVGVFVTGLSQISSFLSYQCIYMWSWIEMLTVSNRKKRFTQSNPSSSALEILYYLSLYWDPMRHVRRNKRIVQRVAHLAKKVCQYNNISNNLWGNRSQERKFSVFLKLIYWLCKHFSLQGECKAYFEYYYVSLNISNVFSSHQDLRI